MPATCVRRVAGLALIQRLHPFLLRLPSLRKVLGPLGCICPWMSHAKHMVGSLYPRQRALCCPRRNGLSLVKTHGRIVCPVDDQHRTRQGRGRRFDVELG